MWQIAEYGATFEQGNEADVHQNRIHLMAVPFATGSRKHTPGAASARVEAGSLTFSVPAGSLCFALTGVYSYPDFSAALGRSGP